MNKNNKIRKIKNIQCNLNYHHKHSQLISCNTGYSSFSLSNFTDFLALFFSESSTTFFPLCPALEADFPIGVTLTFSLLTDDLVLFFSDFSAYFFSELLKDFFSEATDLAALFGTDLAADLEAELP